MNENHPNFLNEDWLKAQRQYWDAWAAIARQDNPQIPNPWSMALDNWWQAVSGSIPSDNRAVYCRMVEQGKVVMQMGQEFATLIAKVGEGMKSGQGWQEALKARFEELKSNLGALPAGQIPDVLNGFRAFSELPMDTLLRAWSGFSALPGDCFQNLRSETWEKLGGRPHKDMEKFLSVPGVGYTRESQEQVQRLARLMLDYQKATEEYLAAHGELLPDTLDRLYRKLVERGEKGESIKSLRVFYDLWVDCSEEAYADFVMSAEFQDVYGRMVNAVMAVKHQLRLLVDENLGAFNMPTRKEVDGLIKRQHEMRRTIRSLQRERREDGGDQKLRGRPSPDEVGALRRELAALRTEVAAAKVDAAAALVTEIPRPAVKVVKEASKAAAKPAKRPAPRWDINSIAKTNEKPAPGRRRAAGKR